ncbi:cytokine receptor family member B16 isoform X3 [Cyclopterus lumpus]|uniref:cytokine receptor family member B16 isoform X3 n=1 Tax=Cyclopterus lumpus TaxID=8103 RepID=UPI0014866F03|nr:cytokine receptor family member B16 isoform X3 [Cyclopterus lumpus]
MMMVVMMMVVMMVVVMMILLDLCTLAAPSSACMRSVDMTHVLRWRPPLAACDTALLYSVQFQGEFELMHLKGTWLNAPECQLIPHTRCDLTFDLGSDSDYNLRVRAQCGSELSAWTELSPPFNRRDTVLMAPAMSVTAVGDALQVTFAKLPLTAVVSVTVWKSGDELQAVVYTMPADQAVLHVAALQEGAEYCVRAQTVLDARIRSGSTDAECVFITGPGPDGAWKRPTTVGVTVIAMAALLFAVFWSVVHCRPHACQSYFHKEPLPRSLDPDWDIQIQVSPEEAELYEPIHVSAAP